MRHRTEAYKKAAAKPPPKSKHKTIMATNNMKLNAFTRLVNATIKSGNQTVEQALDRRYPQAEIIKVTNHKGETVRVVNLESDPHVAKGRDGLGEYPWTMRHS